MKIYKLECLNQDGDIETNGYYVAKHNAIRTKTIMDKYPMNIKYGITQNIIEIETED